MARTLAANIGANTELITLSGDLTASPGDPFKLGSEVVLFRAYDAPLRHPSQINKRRVYMDRGALGTERASHLAGASLVAVRDALVASTDETPPDPFTSGGGGSVQTITRLGPFTLTPSTTNLVNPEDNGALIASIDAGSLVQVIAVNKVAWDSTDPSLTLYLATGVGSSSSTLSDSVSLTQIGNGAAVGAYAEAYPSDATVPLPRWGLASVDCGVYAAVYPLSGTPTTGSTDVYLVVMASA